MIPKHYIFWDLETFVCVFKFNVMFFDQDSWIFFEAEQNVGSMVPNYSGPNVAKHKKSCFIKLLQFCFHLSINILQVTFRVAYGGCHIGTALQLQ